MEVSMARTSDRRYRALRARVLEGKGIVCAGCGEPIDKSLPFPHPMSATADHINPVGRGGSNHGKLQPMHLLCNQRKGKRVGLPETKHSRRW
jgi:5-methylcytosine-specific restriction endonuclease McrA